METPHRGPGEDMGLPTGIGLAESQALPASANLYSRKVSDWGSLLSNLLFLIRALSISEG